MKLAFPLLIVAALLDPISALGLRHSNAEEGSVGVDGREVQSGSCGDGYVNDGVCAVAGHCCSRWGFCGTDDHHCKHTTPPSSGATVSAQGTDSTNSSTGNPTTAAVAAATATDDKNPAQTLDTCLAQDTCMDYVLDGICDAESGFCDDGSDCLDCDKCQAHNLDCGACVAEGCVWCPGDAICRSKPLTEELMAGSDKHSSCKGAEDYQKTCDAAGKDNAFADPLYDSMKWAYEMINVEPVWKMGLTGKGVHVRINDVGIDNDHPEFAGKFDKENSCEDYDEVGPHGTACASIILANGGNDECAVGIAPGATVSSCRIFKKNENSATFKAETLLYKMEVVDISNNSLGPSTCQAKLFRHLRQLQGKKCPFNPDHPESPCGACKAKMHSNECKSAVKLYCPAYYELDATACEQYLDLFTKCDYTPLPSDTNAALKKGVTEGRGGLGTIYTFAAGNDYASGADVNGDSYLNSRYTVSVAGVGKDGVHGSYSTPGAANTISAPGGDHEEFTNIIVAKPGGGCHDIGAGTSYAAPMVSGVVALMLEANSGLGWRDVIGILATTATVTDKEDDSWWANGAQLLHSYKYGFGIANAYAAVNASKTWTNWGPEEEVTLESGVVDLEIENCPATNPTTSQLEVKDRDDFVIETVEVFLDLDHSTRGDLNITLTSPSGTESILHPGKRPESSHTIQSWKLMTIRNYMEKPTGNWTLSITDQDPRIEGGKAGDCLDVDFSVTVFDCPYLNDESNGYCAKGAVVKEDVHNLVSRGNGDINGAEACCNCGGGKIIPDVEKLVAWNMTLYGHTA